MRKNKIFAMAMLAIFTLVLAGCGSDAFNRKFIRKKKQAEGPPEIYNIQPFEKPANTEIYQHAFLYWKSWESELLNALSLSGYPRTANILKIQDCIGSAVSSLTDMESCLNEQKAMELDFYIEELRRIGGMLGRGNLSDSVLSRARNDVGTHKRNVDIRFNYSRIKNDIKDDNSRPE